MQSLYDNYTWEIVLWRTPIMTKWVYEVKND